VTGTLTQWHTGSQRAAVVSGNFATTLKLADKERHRVAGQSDQDHHHGPAEARRFGATLGTLHLKHLRECSSTFRSRWEGPLRGRSRRIQCQHPLDPAREEGVLRQNVDATGIHFTVRQYSSRSMMVSTRVVCAGSLGSEIGTTTTRKPPRNRSEIYRWRISGILRKVRFYASRVPSLQANGRMFRHWQTHHPDRSCLFSVIRTIRREIGAPVANLCARVAPACRIG